MSKIITHSPKTALAYTLMLFFGFFYAHAEPQLLDSASVFYENAEYSKAKEYYERAFQNGAYSDKSLYRMAFIDEQMRNYPLAIFYLKKIAQEFGGKQIEEKIIQLMQKNGSSSYFTDQSDTAYFRFWNQWGWVIWLFFILTGFAFAAWIFTRKNRNNLLWRKVFPLVSLIPFSLLSLLLFLHLFLVHDRAVLISNTAFYTQPGFSAAYEQNIFSTGETVNVVKQTDIWKKISAGNKEAWVPAFVLKNL